MQMLAGYGNIGISGEACGARPCEAAPSADLGTRSRSGREGGREKREREPTAVAIAYGLGKKGSGERSVPLVDGGFVHGETW